MSVMSELNKVWKVLSELWDVIWNICMISVRNLEHDRLVNRGMKGSAFQIRLCVKASSLLLDCWMAVASQEENTLVSLVDTACEESGQPSVRAKKSCSRRAKKKLSELLKSLKVGTKRIQQLCVT